MQRRSQLLGSEYIFGHVDRREGGRGGGCQLGPFVFPGPGGGENELELECGPAVFSPSSSPPPD